MNNTIRILSILLLIQLVTFGFLHSRKDSLSAVQGGVPLLDISAENISTLSITGSESALDLVKDKDKGWILPSLEGFPADTSKVQSLFEKLKGMQLTWPVGTTDIAAKEFKVAEDVFERKLEFKSGSDIERTLYLGSSPGFKKVYARIHGSSETHSIPFSTYEASINASDWIDSNFADVDLLSVKSVEFGQTRLVKKDEALTLANIPEGKKINSTELSSLLNGLSKLRVLDVLGTAEKAEYNLKTPAVVVTYSTDSSDSKVYSLALMEQGEGDEKTSTGILKIDSAPYYLKIPESYIAKLRDFDPASLLEEIESEEGVASKADAAPAELNSSGNETEAEVSVQ